MGGPRLSEVVVTPLPPRDTATIPTPSTTSSTTSAWRPWANLGDRTPDRAYQAHYETASNSLHPSCATTAMTASPMETEDSLELEEITLVGGMHDHLLERGEVQTRRDREARGQTHRGDRRRRWERKEYRPRKGRRHHPCRN